MLYKTGRKSCPELAFMGVMQTLPMSRLLGERMKVGDHWDHRWSIGHFPLGGGPPLPPPPGPVPPPPFPLPLPFPSSAARGSRIIRRTVCIALVGLMSETGRHSGGRIMRTLAGPSVSRRWEADPIRRRRRFLHCHHRFHCRCLHRRRVAAGSHAELFASTCC